MKRTLLMVAATATAIALAAALLLPGLVGALALRQHERQIGMATQASPHIRVTTESFERGWFGSRGRYRVELSDELQQVVSRRARSGEPAGELPALIVDSELHHGPFALAAAFRDGGTLRPVLGTVRSELTVVSNGETLFTLPGAVVTHLGFDGGGGTHYASGPVRIDEPGQHLSWGGADVSVDFNAGATHIESSGRVEALSAVDADGRLTTGPMRFSSTQALTGFGFWLGESKVEMARLAYAGPAEGQTAMEGMHMNYALRMADEAVVAEIELGMAGLSADGWTGGPLLFRIVFTQLEPAALGRLLTRLDQVNTAAPVEQATPDLSGVAGELGVLLANGARFALEELRMGTPDGEVFARINLEFPDRLGEGADNLMQLAFGSSGDLSLRLPMALVAAASASSPDSQQYVRLLLETGFLKAENGHYAIDAVYAGGLLTVNGIPVPMPLSTTT